MAILNLPNDIKSYIFNSLPLKDYASLSETCSTLFKFCTSEDQSRSYFKGIYERNYSSSPLKDQSGNPWRKQIVSIEEDIKAQKIFSKQFKICAAYRCDKLGSLRKKIGLVKPAILTDCLRGLVYYDGNNKAIIPLATRLLIAGADSMKVNNSLMNQSAFRFAVLKNKPALLSLFLKYIPKTEKKLKKIRKLITQLQKNPIEGVDTSLLKDFLKS